MSGPFVFVMMVSLSFIKSLYCCNLYFFILLNLAHSYTFLASNMMPKLGHCENKKSYAITLYTVKGRRKLDKQ